MHLISAYSLGPCRNMPYKCFLCPTKKATLGEDSVKCTNCDARYHHSCGGRGRPDKNGVYYACCGTLGNTSNVYLDSDNSSRQSNIMSQDYTPEFEELDNNSKILFKLLSEKIDRIDFKLDSTVNKFNKKLLDLDERVENLELSTPYIMEEVICEMKNRKFRENNIIIYNLQDSSNASSTDNASFIKLFSNINEDIPFSSDNISVARLGNKFQNNVSRPLKVKLPSLECVHWIFKHRKVISNVNNIIIANDLTPAQREFRAKILRELKERKNKGETDIYMKVVNGMPKIFKGDTQVPDDNQSALERSSQRDIINSV